MLIDLHTPPSRSQSLFEFCEDIVHVSRFSNIPEATAQEHRDDVLNALLTGDREVQLVALICNSMDLYEQCRLTRQDGSPGASDVVLEVADLLVRTSGTDLLVRTLCVHDIVVSIAHCSFCSKRPRTSLDQTGDAGAFAGCRPQIGQSVCDLGCLSCHEISHSGMIQHSLLRLQELMYLRQVGQEDAG